MPFTDIVDNIIASLTDKGRELSDRAPLEGLGWVFAGWSLGREGYDDANPVLVTPIDATITAQTALGDQVYPTASTIVPFAATDFERPNNRSIVTQCRVQRGTAAANFGIGEIGVWVDITFSPSNPSEVGERHLFSISHTPIQAITFNTAKVWRVIHNF